MQNLRPAQDGIERSKKLARPVRFSDLQMRWAMDRRYADKIRSIADAFYDTHCRDRIIDTKNEQHRAATGAIQLPTPVAVHNGRLAASVEELRPARR